jgi:hypothetical protein
VRMSHYPLDIYKPIRITRQREKRPKHEQNGMHSDSLRRPAKPTAQSRGCVFMMQPTLSNKHEGREGHSLPASAMVRGMRRRRAAHSPLNQPGRLGEPPIGVYVASLSDAGLILLGKELPDQFSPAAHADFLEDRLEVVLHCMGRDVKGVRHLCR